MAATVTQVGSQVRVVARPRSITSLDVVNNELLVTYSDGSPSESAGFIGQADLLPDNALTSRLTGDLLISPVSGAQLVGV